MIGASNSSNSNKDGDVEELAIIGDQNYLILGGKIIPLPSEDDEIKYFGRRQWRYYNRDSDDVKISFKTHLNNK